MYIVLLSGSGDFGAWCKRFGHSLRTRSIKKPGPQIRICAIRAEFSVSNQSAVDVADLVVDVVQETQTATRWKEFRHSPRCPAYRMGGHPAHEQRLAACGVRFATISLCARRGEWRRLRWLSNLGRQ